MVYEVSRAPVAIGTSPEPDAFFIDDVESEMHSLPNITQNQKGWREEDDGAFNEWSNSDKW